MWSKFPPHKLRNVMSDYILGNKSKTFKNSLYQLSNLEKLKRKKLWNWVIWERCKKTRYHLQRKGWTHTEQKLNSAGDWEDEWAVSAKETWKAIQGEGHMAGRSQRNEHIVSLTNPARGWRTEGAGLLTHSAGRQSSGWEGENGSFQKDHERQTKEIEHLSKIAKRLEWLLCIPASTKEDSREISYSVLSFL